MPIETRICVAGEKRWRDAGTEPDLAEVLADPVVHLVMRRDGVSPCQLRKVIAEARKRLRGGLCCCIAA
jgi:hypothetical protein